MRPKSPSLPKRVCAPLASVIALTLLGGLLASAPAAAEKPAPAKPPSSSKAADKSAAGCTDVRASVISEAFGYKHVVTLRNGCDKAVECQLWTDVDPTPRHTLRADKGEIAEIITRIGSPASDFKAFKECRFL
jgi:hypothetical protein